MAEVDPLDYRLKVAAAAATLEQAKVGLRRAEEEYGRMKFLYDSKSLAPNDYEKFKATLDGAGEQVRQATANDGLARKQLSDATLVAPIDGYIDMRGIEPGETASPGRACFPHSPARSGRGQRRSSGNGRPSRAGRPKGALSRYPPCRANLLKAPFALSMSPPTRAQGPIWHASPCRTRSTY